MNDVGGKSGNDGLTCRPRSANVKAMGDPYRTSTSDSKAEGPEVKVDRALAEAERVALAWEDLRSRIRLQVALFIGFIPAYAIVALVFRALSGSASDANWFACLYALIYLGVTIYVRFFRCPICSDFFNFFSFLPSRCMNCGARTDGPSVN